MKFTDKVKEFKFSINGKELDSILSKINAAIISKEKHFFISGFNNKLHVVGISPSDGYAVYVNLKADTTGTGNFGIALESLSGIAKNRGQLDFDFDGANLSFKLHKGFYKGKIPTLPVSVDTITYVNDIFGSKFSGVDLKEDIVDLIKEGLSVTKVKDIYTNVDLISYIQLKNKKLSVSCVDNHHFGLFTSEVKTKNELRLAILSTYFQVIENISTGSKSYCLTNNQLRVKNNEFYIVLPATQSEVESYSLASNFIKNLGKSNYSAKLDYDKLSKVLENLSSIYKVNTRLELNCSEDTLQVSIKTSESQATDKIPVKGNKQLSGTKVDPILFKDIFVLAKAIEKISMDIITNKVITFNGKTKSGSDLTLICTVSD